MPRPNSAVKEAPEMAELPAENNDTDSVDTSEDAEVKTNGKRKYTPRVVNIPEGVSTGYGELVAEEPPPARKRGGRGRGPNPMIPKLIEQLKANPGTWFVIGNFKSTSSPDGPWKEAGIKFKHAPYADENGTVVEGLFKRYARFPGEDDTNEDDASE